MASVNATVGAVDNVNATRLEEGTRLCPSAVLSQKTKGHTHTYTTGQMPIRRLGRDSISLGTIGTPWGHHQNTIGLGRVIHIYSIQMHAFMRTYVEIYHY